MARILRDDFDEPQIESIYKVLSEMPTIHVQLSLSGPLDDEQLVSRPIAQPPNVADSWLRVHANAEYLLCVNLTRLGKGRPPKSIHCPKFPKGKDEGWFLSLGNQYDGELYALKRIAYRSNRSTHRLTFVAPANKGRYIYTVYLLSDGYIGFDQQYNVQLEVTEPATTTTAAFAEAY